MSDAISPFNDEEIEVGPGAIPVSLAKILRQDVEVGARTVFAQKTPRRMLEEAISERAWFRGIVLSAALFEHFGSLILQNYLHNKVSSEKLKRLTLERIIIFLYALNLIDQPTYSKMFEIKDKRDELAHNPFAGLDPEQAERLIKKAIECLEALQVADSPGDAQCES